MKRLTFLTLLFACFLSACKTDSSKQPEEDAEPVYSIVEEMPRFPGCEEKTGKDRQACANIKLLAYVRGNLKYPEAAKRAKTEGRAVIGFNIEKDGRVTKAEIIRDPGDGIGEEAKRIVESFPTFLPGKQKGEAVIVRYNLPIRFKLDAAN